MQWHPHLCLSDHSALNYLSDFAIHPLLFSVCPLYLAIPLLRVHIHAPAINLPQKDLNLQNYAGPDPLYSEDFEFLFHTVESRIY